VTLPVCLSVLRQSIVFFRFLCLSVCVYLSTFVYNAFLTEAVLLINNMHLITIINKFNQTEEKLHFVLDYCGGGELFFHLSRLKKFPEPMARFYGKLIYFLIVYHIMPYHIISYHIMNI
jgi:hypothetical protein